MDGRTDGRTDRQTDRQTGPFCLSEVVLPKTQAAPLGTLSLSAHRMRMAEGSARLLALKAGVACACLQVRTAVPQVSQVCSCLWPQNASCTVRRYHSVLSAVSGAIFGSRPHAKCLTMTCTCWALGKQLRSPWGASRICLPACATAGSFTIGQLQEFVAAFGGDIAYMERDTAARVAAAVAPPPMATISSRARAVNPKP
jgi:hypothetical protein